MTRVEALVQGSRRGGLNIGLLRACKISLGTLVYQGGDLAGLGILCCDNQIDCRGDSRMRLS